MRKSILESLLILGAIVLFAGACNYQDNSYTTHREWDTGTFLTKRGVVKYFSATPDTATSISDITAHIQTKVNYFRSEDSIVMYGHCWSRNPDVKFVDTLATKFYPSDAPLEKGTEIKSIISGLEDETQYYVSSYIITGTGTGENIVHKDTAYNPVELAFSTDPPQNLWEERTEFSGQPYLGAVSFTYNDKLYVGLGHNEIWDDRIYEYDPQNETWSEFTTLPPGTEKFTNAVAFVIEDVQIGQGTYRDYLYVGTGLLKGDEKETTDNFFRYDFDKDQWSELRDDSKFSGGPRQNAIGFSIDGKGYVALGSFYNSLNGNEIVLDNVYMFDPEFNDNDNNYPQGRWYKAASFPGGKRTQASVFTLDGVAYISCGKDEDGEYQNDLWAMSLPTTGAEQGDVNWSRKRDFPGTARIEAVGYSINDMGYIGTGLDNDSLRSDYWRYNPYINNWDERASFSGLPRMEAIGAGLKYADDDYRGYIGLGGAETYNNEEAYFYLDFWEYRP